MATWLGATRMVVVTGLPIGFAGSCDTTCALPDTAVVHPYPHDADDAVVFTVFEAEARRVLGER